jgi:hypothetical protein
MQHEQSTSAASADPHATPIEQRTTEQIRTAVLASEQRITEQFRRLTLPYSHRSNYRQQHPLLLINSSPFPLTRPQRRRVV